ncbi:MAG: isocitrate dehydrogenase (NADP(+)) [Candidatus Geothermarchaeales archaeon]
MTVQLSQPPREGEKITVRAGKLSVPREPIVPQIEGDGTGRDISPVAKKVLRKAAQLTGRDVRWFDIPAGEEGFTLTGQHLPEKTIETIREYKVALKGPLTTPVAGGFRSLNVTLRQVLDLYACVRPVFYLRGMPSPMKHPEHMDMVIFRENTEDVYAGIEWPSGSPEAEKVLEFLNREMGCNIRTASGVGVKPMSEYASKRLVRRALTYALDRGRRSVTLVHKGNIMKYTEGAFRDWGYEVAREEFGDSIVTEQDLWKHHRGEVPTRKIVVKHRIADNMLQQLMTRTTEYDVLALPNLNGDYVSDAAAAQVGGLGVSPGANLGDFIGVFEPTHGSAPKYAGLDKVNPTAILLSGGLMFEFFEWFDAADLVRKAIEETIMQKTVTYDVHRQIQGGQLVKCSEFGKLVVENMDTLTS